MKNDKNWLVILISFIIIVVFGPAIYFILSWVMGFFLMIFLGKAIVLGLAAVGIYILPGAIPFICGVLGIISFFLFSSKKRVNVSMDKD